MLIVLVQIFDRRQEIQAEYPALGLGYLAAYARRFLEDVEFLYLDNVADIVAAQPDVVGITTVSENFHLAREYAKELKKELDVPLVLGGVHVSMLPHTMTDDFDVGVIGEGEQTFVELLRHIRERGNGWKESLDSIDGLCFHSNGRLVLTKPRELIETLDDIPHPDRELLFSGAGNASDQDTYSIFSARGCPYNCNFCSSTNFWRRTRYFSAEYVIEEIRELKERFGARSIFFWDDLFVVNRQRLNHVEKMLRETGLGEEMSFICSLRSDVVDEDLCETLRSMNISVVGMGLESGSDNVLKLMNKRTTIAQHEKALRLLNDFGIIVHGSFIIGYPGETAGDMRKTVEFIEKHLGSDLYSFDVYPFMLYPGTKSWAEAAERGLLDAVAEPYRFKVDEYSLNLDDYVHANDAAGEQEALTVYLYLKGLAYKNFMNINRDLAHDRMKDVLVFRQYSKVSRQHSKELSRFNKLATDRIEYLEKRANAGNGRVTSPEPRREQVSTAWSSDERLGKVEGPRLEWTESEFFSRLVNRRLSGDVDHDLLDWFATRRPDRPFEKAISIGCSFCKNERRLIDMGVCEEIVGVEVSAEALAEDERLKGDRKMRFFVRNLETEELPDEQFDVAFCFTSLHHINNLAFVIKGLYERLKPGGLLFIHEYVGPSRFQWQKVCLDVIGDIYDLLPSRYHFNHAAGGEIPWLRRSAVSFMLTSDPSEAVRSGEVLRVLDMYFTSTDRRGSGGSILLHAYCGTIENFDDEDRLDAAFLEISGQIEERFLQAETFASIGIADIMEKKETPAMSERDYELDMERGRAILEGEKRLRELDAEIETVEQRSNDLSAMIESENVLGREMSNEISRLTEITAPYTASRSWRLARRVKTVMGSPRANKGSRGTLTDTAAGIPEGQVQGAEVLRYGTKEGRAILQYLRDANGARGSQWRYLLYDGGIFPAGNWLLLGFEQDLGRDLAAARPDVMVDTTPRLGKYDCVLVQGGDQTLRQKASDLVADGGLLVGVDRRAGDERHIRQFIEEVVTRMPGAFVDLPEGASARIAESPVREASRPYTEVFCFGTLVDDILSKSFHEKVREDDMARALYGLILYSQSVYSRTGFDLPRVQVVIELEAPPALEEPDYLEGVEFDTLAIQEREIERLSQELAAAGAERMVLEQRHSLQLQANQEIRKVLDIRRREDKIVARGGPFTALRLMALRVSGGPNRR